MKEKISKEEVTELYNNSSMNTTMFKEILNAVSYPDSQQYNVYAKYFTLSIGALLMVSGVMFFFAFNWEQIPPFAKFGIIVFLLTLAVGASLLLKLDVVLRKTALLCACILVGVLFAVFGQVYQSGANAYDLFFVWTLAILPWVAVSFFTPTWLAYWALCNVTFVLYNIQNNIAYDVIGMQNSWMLLLNIGLLFLGIYYNKFTGYIMAKYYELVLSLCCSILATFIVCVHIIYMIYEDFSNVGQMVLQLAISLLWLVFSFWWSKKQKAIMLLIYSLLSVISIVFVVLICMFEFSIGGLFLYCIYLIASIYLLIKIVYKQHKTWEDEK